MPYRKTEFVERKRVATRARITAAATELVESGGWQACQLKSVAKLAGVSTGSIYSHFARVTDLYIEVFRQIAESELEVIAEVVYSSGPPDVRLVRAVDCFAARALRGRTRAYAVIAEPVAPEVEVVRQQVRRRFVGLFEHVIAAGVQDGCFGQQDAATAAACVLGALNEALILPLAPDAGSLDDGGRSLRDQVCTFCLSAVTPRNSISDLRTSTAENS